MAATENRNVTADNHTMTCFAAANIPAGSVSASQRFQGLRDNRRKYLYPGYNLVTARERKLERVEDGLSPSLADCCLERTRSQQDGENGWRHFHEAMACATVPG